MKLKYIQKGYIYEMTQPAKAARRTHFLSCIQPVVRHNLRSFHIVLAVSQRSECIQSQSAATFEPRDQRPWDPKWILGIDAAFRPGFGTLSGMLGQEMLVHERVT